MKAQVLGFGEIEVDGDRYDHDLVIKAGEVRRRKKGRSKRFCDEYGHTPLAAEEDIPWVGKRLIVGTGVCGKLPIMPAVEAEAKRRGIELGSADQASLPTPVFGKTWGEFCDIAGDVLIALFGLRQP